MTTLVSRKSKPAMNPDGGASLGSPIPEEVKKHISKSLMGRVMLRLFERACRTPDLHPSSRTWATHLRHLARQNPVVGKLVRNVRQANSWTIPWHQIHRHRDQAELLSLFEREGFRDTRALEVIGIPNPLPTVLGVLAIPEEMKGGGWVYTLAVFDESFPDGLRALFEARAFAANPDPPLIRSSRDGWNVVASMESTRDPLVSLALDCLEALLSVPERLRCLSIGDANAIELTSDNVPSEDPELVRLLREAQKGVLPVTNATVPFALVEVVDPSCALQVPDSVVDLFVDKARSGTPVRLLLYWNGNRYKSSDDHAAYMAYRRLRAENVEATILGDTGPTIAVHSTGGVELVPGVQVISDPPDDVIATWNWQIRESSDTLSSGYVALTALYIQLAELVASPTSESDLHKLLATTPLAIDAYGNRLFSEVRLGATYRIDLVLEYCGSNAKLLLIELESASHLLFTNKGRWRSPIVHAIQQVEDWIRWWHEHPNQIPNGWDPSTPIDGLVVAGRARDHKRDDAQRLIQLNRGKRIQVITYDDLLDRIERLLASR